jgi:hypothetical protein
MRLACEFSKGKTLPTYLSVCLSIYLPIYLSMALQPFIGLRPLFSFLVFYTVDTIYWTGDQPAARLLSAHRTAQTQNKGTEISMPREGNEPVIPVSEREKAVHALDCVATVII